MQLHIILTCIFGCLNRALVGLFKNVSCQATEQEFILEGAAPDSCSQG